MVPDKRIPIEDNYADVLTKAAVGQRLGHSALAERSGIEVDAIRSLFAENYEPSHARQIAALLGLDPERLAAMVESDWYPKASAVEGLECFNTPFPQAGYAGASANNFLIFDGQSREAVVFDTGVNAVNLLKYLERHQLKLKALVLTHTHRDHVAAYKEILDETDCDLTYAPELEPYAEAKPIAHGDVLQLASFQIEARLTNGHSPGGMSYIVEGLSRPVAIVGDSIFCLSQGGAKLAYTTALQNNREQILTLPPETILCPGHGPMTTVEQELVHNPFFG